MRLEYVRLRLAEIEATFDKIKTGSVGVSDSEIQSFLSRYVVVFSSGVYEDCFEHLLVEFSKKGGNLGITSFFLKMLADHFRNPEYSNLKGWLNFINPDYGKELDKRLETSPGSKEALGSIVANKNAVAHGQSCSATLNDIEKFHQQVLPIFNAIEDILEI